MSWNFMGASVIGTGHEKTGTPCQDAYRIEQTDSGVLLVAFADGAGSASLSEVGAGVAVETALETLKSVIDDNADWGECLRQAFTVTQGKIVCEADSQGEETRELATTLTLIISDGIRTVGGSVGDGAVILETDEGLVPFLVPERGEYLNETHFLHDVEIGSIELQTYKMPISGMAAFTDGLQMLALKLPEAEPHVGFFAPLFKFMRNENAKEEELRQFLQSPRVTNRTDDDLTLILAI